MLKIIMGWNILRFIINIKKWRKTNFMLCVAIKTNNNEQKLISKVFAEFNDIEAVFFTSFSAATTYIEQNLIDVVFLGIDGQNDLWEEQFDFLKSIDRTTDIVLISDNRIDAVKAFELEATDFILAPISESRLDDVLQRIKVSKT